MQTALLGRIARIKIYFSLKENHIYVEKIRKIKKNILLLPNKIGTYSKSTKIQSLITGCGLLHWGG